MLSANIRGFRSKEASLSKLLKTECPSICAYNETLMTGRNKVEHDYYMSFSKNRKGNKGGGVSTSVRKELESLLYWPGRGRRRMSTW